MVSILFVCLGNICRSPCAEGVMKRFVEQGGFDHHVESCGLGDWHEGHLPDERMQKTAHARGIVLSSRAKPFQTKFFESFDLILAADKSVLDELHKRAQTPEHKAKIHLMTKYSLVHRGKDIPDPYHHELGQFEYAMDMIEDACKGLLEQLEKTS